MFKFFSSLLESKALALDESAASPKLKLWTPSDLALLLESKALALDESAASPKLKLWTPSAFDVKIKKLEHQVCSFSDQSDIKSPQ